MRFGRTASSAGFTLLELLVVLTLVALTTAVVLPATMRWLDSANERGWREDFVALLSALPTQAFASGRSLELDADQLRALAPELPADIELRIDKPLRYGVNGAAVGGRIELRRGDRTVQQWRIEPISGRVIE
ncbi:prepilin-type N-terminal cleavage/methylation domain-containing protein [Roseateles sp. P5_E11]